MTPGRSLGTVQVVASVPEAFAAVAAGALAKAQGNRCSLFLSGGDTARQCYQALARLAGPGGADPVDWSSVDVYWGDERCVPLDDPDSNHRLCTEALLDRVGPVGSDHPMYRSGPPEAAADAYQALVAPLPAFDLVHLGMGPDGHTASLFPGSPCLDLDDPDVLVVANRDPVARNPLDRITLTLAAIARARLAVFTVAGGAKHEALARVAAGEDLPAARVVADEVLWLVDPDAAGDLDLS